MYHSFPGVDQYSWSDAHDFPFMFPSSPAPSTCSSGTPQMQLDLYDPASTPFYQNSFKELGDFYAPSYANVSTPPEREEVLNALMQLYSANPCPPGRSTRQTHPEQQPVFSGTQSHPPFDMDNLCLSPTAYKDHNSAPIAPIPLRHPPAPPRFLPHPPTNQASFPQNSQLDSRNFLTYPIPLEPVSKPDDPSRQEDSRVTAPPPERQPTQRTSGSSSKKRKTGKAVNYDDMVRALLYVSFPTSKLKFLRRKGFPSMLHDGEAGEPRQTLEIRWTQAQCRPPSG